MRTTLGNICNEDRRTINPESHLVKELNYLGLEDIESGSGHISLAPKSRSKSEGISTTFFFTEEHVLYSKLRPYLNKVALPSSPGRCTTELIPLLPAQGVDREFLALLLRTPMTVQAAMAEKTGSRMPRANMRSLFSLPIDLPDVPTQRRMADRLKAQLTEVEAARKAAMAAKADSDKLLDHCLREAFQNIVPLSTNPLNPVTPKGWRWAPLMELARLESGHTPSRRHPEYWENGDIPWLALPDIRALDCRVAVETSEQTNLLGIKNSSARILPPDTVALSRTASVGFVTIFGREMCTSQDFVNWICGEQIVPRFLLWLLRASRNLIREVATGATHKTVYMDVVHNFHVCLPAIETQEKIVARIDAVQSELDQLSNRQNEQLEALNKLPAAYLREAFNPISTHG